MLCIPLTKKQRSRIGKAGVSLSIGTWVRIPGPPKLYLIFSPGVHMQHSKRGLSYASRSQLPSGPPGRSNDPDWRFTMNPGQHAPMESQKSSRLDENGPGNCNSNTLFGPNTPWVCSFLFSFHYFPIFVLLLLLS